MDKANLVEYYLDIILGCPHCDYVFELSTHEIPTEGSTYHVCEKCQIPLEIKPISIEIEFKKSIKIRKQKREKKKKTIVKYQKQNKSIEKARLVIKSYGFTTEQFNSAFNKVEGLYQPGFKPISTEYLVKEVLARIDNKHESAKT
jgi:hypothetical protein